METITSWLRDLDPWWIFASAITLVLIDWAFLQTEAFLTLGLALAPIGVLHALHAPPRALIWLFPVFLLAAYFMQRKFYLGLTKATKKLRFEQRAQDLIGTVGTLQVVLWEDKGAHHFYETNTALIDPAKPGEPQRLYRVTFDDGTVHPADPPEGPTPKGGEKVKVIAVLNGTLKLDYF